jgi:hypothetical protein
LNGARRFLKSIATFLSFNFLCINFRISENYAVELSLLHPIRNISDGLTLLELKVNADWYKGDHNPKHEIEFVFLNVMLLEFRIYNVNHEEET